MIFNIIVVGRLKSQRLPLKALLPLGNSFNLSSFLLTRLIGYFMADSDVNIAYATSDLDQDQLLYDNLSSDYPIYRGHPDNVIARIIKSNSYFSNLPQFYIRVTADNPFTCPVHIQSLIDFARINPSVDYCLFPDLNTGLRAELISRTYLERLLLHVANPESSEYMSYMLDRPEYASVSYLDSHIASSFLNYSYTVDFQHQYDFVASLCTSGFSPSSSLHNLYYLSSNSDIPCFDEYRYQRPSTLCNNTFNCKWLEDPQ